MVPCDMFGFSSMALITASMTNDQCVFRPIGIDLVYEFSGSSLDFSYLALPSVCVICLVPSLPVSFVAPRVSGTIAVIPLVFCIILVFPYRGSLSNT